MAKSMEANRQSNAGESPAANPRDFSARALTASIIFVGALALATLLWYSIAVLLMIFAGVLLAILLRGLAEYLSEYTGLSVGWSLIIVFLAIIALLGILIWLASSRLLGQAMAASDDLPRAIQSVKARMQSDPLGEKLLRFTPSADAFMARRSNLLGRVTGVVSGALGVAVTGIVIIFTALFFALNPRLYIRGLLHMIPRHRRQRVGETMGAIGYSLKRWMTAQAIDMVIIASATAAGLWLLGVELALLFGVIAGIFNFIPNFGPLIALIPATLVALADSPAKALGVVILFIVLQSLEGYVLLPLLQRRAVHIPPALTITMQVLLGMLAGGLGLALSAPLAVAGMIAVKMLYVEDVIGDDIKTPADGDAREEVREVQQSVRESKRREASADDDTG